MFRNDQHARVLLRYPTRPVRLGQAPLPAQYPNAFPAYLAAVLGWPYAQAHGSGPDTWYVLSRLTMVDGQELRDERVVSAAEAAPHFAVWSAYWTPGAAWTPGTAAQGTVTTAPQAPAPAPAGADLAQITNVALPSAAVPAGAQFTLQVTVLNVGAVTWSPWYTVVLQAPPGTPTSAPQSFAALPSAVAPGQSATVTITAWAPTQPGTYAYAVGMYNPTSARLSPLVTAGLIVIPATVGSSVVPTGAGGYVSAQEFGSYVEAMLAQQRQLQGAVAGMQAGAAQQYSPTYVGQPGPPSMSPADQEAGAAPVVMQASVVPVGLFGLPWWFWFIGLALMGGGVYYLYGTPAGRRRLGRLRGGGTTVTVQPGRPGPSRRRRTVRRRPR